MKQVAQTLTALMVFLNGFLIAPGLADQTAFLINAANVKTPIPPSVAKKGYTKLIFEDDFADLDLSPSGGGRHKWYNGLWYSPPANFDYYKIGSGILILSAPFGQRGAMISTLSRRKQGEGLTFSHGYFEARLALNEGGDNWAAFWLFSRERAEGTDKNHWCEIDIYEHFGPGRFVGTVHEWKDKKSTFNSNHIQLLQADANVWHKYGLLWEPERLTWYFDDQVIMTAPTPAICNIQRLFLILNAANRKSRSDQLLYVDWVRVFARQ